MGQRARRLTIAVGTVVWLVASTGAETSAQTSRMLEFGPDAIEFAPSASAAREITLGTLIEPGAGNWRPWVLASGRELRLPPPPDERSTKREQQELRKLAVEDDAATLERIRYWDSGAPAHRWNERLAELIVRDDAGNLAGTTAFTLLNITIHDALIAAWDSKYAYRRPRPSELDARLAPEVTVPRSPSYPCEHAVAAGAAAEILTHLFPAHAASLAAAAHEAAWTRVVAGAVYPSDSKAGLALGRAVAARVVESMKEERSVSLELHAMPNPRLSQAPPTGVVEVTHVDSIPRGDSRPSYLALTEEAQVSLHRRLNEEIRRRLADAALEGNAPRAARVYALAHVAHHVALITSASHLWRSGEAGLAATLVLDHLLPPGRSRHLRWTGENASLGSRAQDAEGGFRPAGTGFLRDVEARLEIGSWVAAAVIERARRDGAE